MKWRRWFTSAYWRNQFDRDLLIELIALQRWQQLPNNKRQSDHAEVLKEIASATTAQITAGEMHDHHDQRLAELRTDSAICNVLSRDERQQLRKQRGIYRRELRQSSPFWMLSFRQLSHLIPLVTAFFFFSGYLVVSRYLAALNVNVARFFTLWDYVSSSMNALSSLLYSLLLAFAFMALSVRKTKLRALQNLLQIRRPLLWLRWFGQLLLIVIMLLHYTGMTAPFVGWLFYNCVYFVAVILPTIGWRLAKPARAIFIGHFVVIYSFFMYITIESAIEYAHTPWTKHDAIYVVTTAQQKASYRLLAGSSSYLIAQDQALAVHIFPVQQIESLVLKPATEDSKEAAHPKEN